MEEPIEDHALKHQKKPADALMIICAEQASFLGFSKTRVPLMQPIIIIIIK